MPRFASIVTPAGQALRRALGEGSVIGVPRIHCCSPSAASGGPRARPKPIHRPRGMKSVERGDIYLDATGSAVVGGPRNRVRFGGVAWPCRSNASSNHRPRPGGVRRWSMSGADSRMTPGRLRTDPDWRCMRSVAPSSARSFATSYNQLHRNERATGSCTWRIRPRQADGAEPMRGLRGRSVSPSSRNRRAKTHARDPPAHRALFLDLEIEGRGEWTVSACRRPVAQRGHAPSWSTTCGESALRGKLSASRRCSAGTEVTEGEDGSWLKKKG